MKGLRMRLFGLLGMMMIISSFSLSCAVRPRSTGESKKDKVVVSLKPAEQKSTAKLSEYRLGYGDVVEVKFFNHSEYNELVSVRPDGMISLQRIGDIPVVGMTPSELDEIVTKAYEEILINPDVTVFVREFGGQQVYVMGEVDKPGSYAVQKGMTLLRAIAQAGGPKPTAKMNSIILIRGDGDSNAEVTRLDLEFEALSKNMKNDMPVQAYDIIYVPRTFIADMNNFVSQLYDIILPPFDVWSRYQYWYSRK